MRRVDRMGASVVPENKKKRIETGDLVIDGKQRQVTLDGKEVEVTAKKFDLLYLPASNPGQR